MNNQEKVTLKTVRNFVAFALAFAPLPNKKSWDPRLGLTCRNVPSS